MKPTLDSFWRHSRAMTAALLGLFAVGSVAMASDVEQPRQKIVALGFDVASNVLIKAYPRALYRSGNEGRDWEPITLPQTIERGRIAAASVSAKGERALYIAGPGFGVLRSADGGRSWKIKNDGLPTHEIVALALHAEQPDTLYVYIAGKGIYRSENAGDRWRLMDAGPRDKILQLVHSNMPESMQTGWLFAATIKGVGRSMDCFCGWRDAGGLGHAVTAVAYDPRQPKEVYAATAEGLFVSEDGGERWSRAHSPGHMITALVATPAGTLYAAVGQGELFRSDDHGRSWGRADG